MNEQQIKQKVLEILKSNNWNYIESKNLNKSSKEIIIEDIFFKKIRELNKNLELTDKDIEKVLDKLLNSDGKEVLRYLKKGISIKLEKTNNIETIKIIDYENIENNSFIVSDEVRFKQMENEIYVDLVLFINGIPFIIIENESMKDGEWKKGFQQIVNYIKLIPKLANISQIGLVIADNIYYFPIDEEFIKKEESKLEGRLQIWKPDENRKTNDWNTILNSTIGYLLKPEILLKIIKYYTFYQIKENRKILPRYFQFYTVEKLYNKFKERLEGKSSDKSWVVWHYQGSGKSMTMAYLSKIILNKLGKEFSIDPVILIVVDRLELQNQMDEQTFKNVDLDLEHPEKVIDNLRELLIDILRKGEKPQSGVYIVTIQKFGKSSSEESEDEDLNTDDLYNSVKGVGLTEEDIKRISGRKDIFILIDEAHRSHYGKLGKILNYIFGSAFYVAFTGTPLLGKDKNTFRLFGEPIDIYFIDEAEEDKYIVPIFYRAEYDIINLTLDILKKEKEIKDNEEYNKVITEVLEGYLPENLENIEKIYNLNESLKRKLLDLRRLVFENDYRIKEISKKISEHFKNEVEPLGFKAMVIVATRKAAVRYVKILKELLGEDTVEAIITYQGTEDDTEILNYREYLIKKYGKGLKDYNELNDIIKNKFKEDENPKILVVVNKLITGFDEKKLQTIYIDRFMVSHTLLQAIGRCDRPYPEKNKVNGLIVDFVGLIDRLKKAIDLYFGTKDIKLDQSILLEYKDIKSELKKIIDKINEKIFNIVDMDLNKELSNYKKYLENNNVESIKDLIDDIILDILENGLDGKFREIFREFESTLFSPVTDLNIREEFYIYYEFLLLIKSQIDSLKENEIKTVDDIKRIANIKAEEILDKLYKNTTIQQFLTFEKKELSEIVSDVKSGKYINIIDLNKLSNNEKESKKVLAKSVKAMIILKENEPAFVDIIDKIIKKIQDYNRKKYNSYMILSELIPEIKKIQEIEDIKNKYNFDSDGLFIYNLLSESIKDLNEEELINISKKIREKILEAEEHKESNDFCRILSRNIQFGVVISLLNKNIDENIKENIVKRIKEHFANKYKECQDELLR
ncbi:type I restriction-modification system, restriction subunit R (EC 3.1.21.3) [Nanoarchaeota archaeon]